MQPWTTYHGDQFLAQGLRDVAETIEDYRKNQQLGAMQEGFVAAAVQSGAMAPDKLAEFAKGNIGKKLALGAEAQMAMKNFMDQQQLAQGSARLGMQGQGITEEARQFDIAQRQRQAEMADRGKIHINAAPGAPTIVSNQGTGQFQVLPDESAGDEWPPQIYTDPQTKQSFIRRGGKAYPLRTEQEDALKKVMADFMAQQLGVAPPGAQAPAAAPGGNPPLPPVPAAPSIPTVKSKAERDALPKGTRYIGPDGKTYTKQ